MSEMQTTQQEAYVFRALRRFVKAVAPAELERTLDDGICIDDMPAFIAGLEEARKRDRFNSEAGRKAFLRYRRERQGSVNPLPLP